MSDDCGILPVRVFFGSVFFGPGGNNDCPDIEVMVLAALDNVDVKIPGVPVNTRHFAFQIYVYQRIPVY